MYVIIHIVCVIYCLLRLYNRYHQSSLDGVTGTSPGLETVVMIFFAPIFAIVDIVLLAIFTSIRYHRNQKGKDTLNS